MFGLNNVNQKSLSTFEILTHIVQCYLKKIMRPYQRHLPYLDQPVFEWISICFKLNYIMHTSFLLFENEAEKESKMTVMLKLKHSWIETTTKYIVKTYENRIWSQSFVMNRDSLQPNWNICIFFFHLYLISESIRNWLPIWEISWFFVFVHFIQSWKLVKGYMDWMMHINKPESWDCH